MRRRTNYVPGSDYTPGAPVMGTLTSQLRPFIGTPGYIPSLGTMNTYDFMDRDGQKRIFDPKKYFDSFQNGREEGLDSVDDVAMLSWAHNENDANRYAINIKSYQQTYDKVLNNYELDPMVREEAAKHLAALRKYSPEAGKTLADAIEDDDSDEMNSFKEFQQNNPDIGEKIMELANLRRGLDSDKEQLVNEKMGQSMYGDSLKKQYFTDANPNQIPFEQEQLDEQQRLDDLYGPLQATNRRGEIEINPARAKAEYDWLASKRANNASFLGDSWLGDAFMRGKSMLYGTINAVSSLIPGVPNADLKTSSIDNDPTYDDSKIAQHMEKLQTMFGGLNDNNEYRDKNIVLRPSLDDPTRKVYTIDQSIKDQYQTGMSISDYIRNKDSGHISDLDRAELLQMSAEQPIKKWAGDLYNTFGSSDKLLQSASLADLNESIRYFASQNPASLIRKEGYDDDVSITPSGYLRDLTGGETWGRVGIETLSMGADMLAGGFKVAGKAVHAAPKALGAISKLTRAGKAADVGIGVLDKLASPLTKSKMMAAAMEGIQKNQKAASAFKLLTEVGKAAPETALTFAIAHGLTDRNLSSDEIEQSLISGAIFGSVSASLSRGFNAAGDMLRNKLPGLNKSIDKEIQRLALNSSKMPTDMYENALANLKSAKVLELSKLSRDQKIASLLAEASGFPIASALGAAANAPDDKAQAFWDHITSNQALTEVLQGILFNTLMPHHNAEKERARLLGLPEQQLAKMSDYTYGAKGLYISAKQARDSHRRAKQVFNDMSTHLENLYTPEGTTAYSERVEAANEIMRQMKNTSPKELSEVGEGAVLVDDSMFPTDGSDGTTRAEKPMLPTSMGAADEIKSTPSTEQSTPAEELTNGHEHISEDIPVNTASDMFETARNSGFNYTGRKRSTRKPIEEAATEESTEPVTSANDVIDTGEPVADDAGTNLEPVVLSADEPIVETSRDKTPVNDREETLSDETGQSMPSAAEDDPGPREEDAPPELDADRRTATTTNDTTIPTPQRVQQGTTEATTGTTTSGKEPKTAKTGDVVDKQAKETVSKMAEAKTKKVKVENIFSKLGKRGREARDKWEKYKDDVIRKASYLTSTTPGEDLLFKDKDFEFTIEDAQKASLAREYIKLVNMDPELAKLVAFDTDGKLTSNIGAAGRLLQKMIILNKYAGQSTYNHEKMHLVQKMFPGLGNKLIKSVRKLIKENPVLRDIAKRYEERYIQEAIDKGRIKNDRYYRGGRAKVLQSEIQNRVAWEIAATMAENAYHDLPKTEAELSKALQRDNDYITMETRESQTKDWESIKVSPSLVEIMQSLKDAGISTAQNISIVDQTGQFKKADQPLDSRDDVMLSISNKIETSRARIAELTPLVEAGDMELYPDLVQEKRNLEAAQLAYIKHSGEYDKIYDEIKNVVEGFGGRYHQNAIESVRESIKKERDLPRIMQELYGQTWDTEPESKIFGESEYLLNRDAYEKLDADQRAAVANQHNGKVKDINGFFDNPQARETIQNMIPSDRLPVAEQADAFKKIAVLFSRQNDYNQQRAIDGDKSSVWMNDEEVKRFTISSIRKIIGDAGYKNHVVFSTTEGKLNISMVTPEKSKFMHGVTVTASKRQAKSTGYTQFVEEVGRVTDDLPFESESLRHLSEAFGSEPIPMAMSFQGENVDSINIDGYNKVTINKYDGKPKYHLEDGETISVKHANAEYGEGRTYYSLEGIAADYNNGKIDLDHSTIAIYKRDSSVAALSGAKNLGSSQIASGIKVLPIGDNSTVCTDMSKFTKRMEAKGILKNSKGIGHVFTDKNDINLVPGAKDTPALLTYDPIAVKRLMEGRDYISKVETQLLNSYLCGDEVFGLNMEPFMFQAGGKERNIMDYIRYSNKSGKPEIVLSELGKKIIDESSNGKKQWDEAKRLILSKIGQDGQSLSVRQTVDAGNMAGEFQCNWGGADKKRVKISFDIPMSEALAGNAFAAKDGSYLYIKVHENGKDRLLTAEEGVRIHQITRGQLSRVISSELNEKLSLRMLGKMDMLQMRVLDPSMSFMKVFERNENGSASIGKAIEKYLSSMYREGENLSAKSIAAMQQAVYGDSASGLFVNGGSNSSFIITDKDGDFSMRALYIDQAEDMLKTYFPNNPEMQEYFKEKFNDAGTVFTCREAQDAFAQVAGLHKGMSLKNEYTAYNGGTKIHVKHAMHDAGLNLADYFCDYYAVPAVADFFDALARNGVAMIIPSTATKMGGVHKYGTVTVGKKEYYHNGKRIIGRNDNGKLVIDDDMVSKGDIIDRSKTDDITFLRDDNGQMLNTFNMKISGKNAVKHMPQFTSLSSDAYAYPQTVYELQSPEAAAAFNDMIRLNGKVDIKKIDGMFAFLSGFKTEGDKPTNARNDAEAAEYMKNSLELMIAKAEEKAREFAENPAPGQTADAAAYRYAAKLIRSCMPGDKVDINKMAQLIVKSGVAMCGDHDLSTIKKSPHVPQLFVQTLGHMIADAMEGRLGGTKATLAPNYSAISACANGIRQHCITWLKRQGVENSSTRQINEIVKAIIPTIDGYVEPATAANQAHVDKFKDYLIKDGVINPDGTIIGIDYKTGMMEDYGDICIVSSDYVRNGIVEFNDKIFTGIMPHDTQESVVPMRVIGVLPSHIKHNLSYNAAMMIGLQGRDFDIDSGCIYNPKIRAKIAKDKDLMRQIQTASDNLWHAKHDQQKIHTGPTKIFINAIRGIAQKIPAFDNQQCMLDGNMVSVPNTSWAYSSQITAEYMKQRGDKIESDLPHMPKGLSFEEQRKYVENIIGVHPSMITFGRNTDRSIDDIVGTESYTKNPYKYKQERIGPMTASLSNIAKIIQRLYDPTTGDPHLITFKIPTLKESFGDVDALNKRLEQHNFETKGMGKKDAAQALADLRDEIFDYVEVPLKLNFDKQSFWQSLGKEGGVDVYTALGLDTSNPSKIIAHMLVDNIKNLSTFEFNAVSDSIDSLIAQLTPPIEQNFKRAKLHGKNAQLPIVDKMRGVKYDDTIADLSDALITASPGFAQIAKSKQGRTLRTLMTVKTTNGLADRVKSTGLSDIVDTIDGFVSSYGVSKINNDPALNKLNFAKLNRIPSRELDMSFPLFVEGIDGSTVEQHDAKRLFSVLVGKMEQIFSNRNTGHAIIVDNKSYTPSEAITMAMLHWTAKTADYTRSPIMKLGPEGYAYSSERPFEVNLPMYKTVTDDTSDGVKVMRYISYSGNKGEHMSRFGQYELSIQAFPRKQVNGKHELVYRFKCDPIGGSLMDLPKLPSVELPLKELLKTADGSFDFDARFNELIDTLHGLGNSKLASRDSIIDYIVNSITHDYSQYNGMNKSAPMLTGEVGRNVDTKEAFMHEMMATFPLFLRSEMVRRGVDIGDPQTFVNRIAGEMCNLPIGRDYLMNRSKQLIGDRLGKMLDQPIDQMSNTVYDAITREISYRNKNVQGKPSIEDYDSGNIGDVKQVSIYDTHMPNPLLLYGTNNQFRAHLDELGINPTIDIGGTETSFEDIYSSHISDTFSKIRANKDQFIADQKAREFAAGVYLGSDEFALTGIDGHSIPAPYREGQSYRYRDVYGKSPEKFHPVLRKLTEAGINNPELGPIMQDFLREQAVKLTGVDISDPKEPIEKRLAEMVGRYNEGLGDEIALWLDKDNPNREEHFNNIITSLPRYLDEIRDSQKVQNPGSRFWGHFLWNGIIKMNKGVKISMLAKTANKMVVDAEGRLFDILTESANGLTVVNTDYSGIKLKDGSSLDFVNGKMMTTLEQIHMDAGDNILHFVNNFTEHIQSFVDNVFDHIRPVAKSTTASEIHDTQNTVNMASALAHNAEKLFVDENGDSMFWIRNEKAKSGNNSDYTLICEGPDGKPIYADFVSHGEESWNNISNHLYQRIASSPGGRKIFDEIISSQDFVDGYNKEEYLKMAITSYLKSKLLLNGYIPGMVNSFRATLQSINKSYGDVFLADSQDFNRANTALTWLLTDTLINGHNTGKALSYYPQHFRTEGELHNYYQEVFSRAASAIASKIPLKGQRLALYSIADSFGIHLKQGLPDEVLLRKVQEKLPEAYKNQKGRQWIDKIRPVNTLGERGVNISNIDSGIDFNVPMSRVGLWSYTEGLAKTFTHAASNMLENMYHGERLRMEQERGSVTNPYHVEEATGLFRTLRGDTFNYSTTVDNTTDYSNIPVGTPLVLNKFVEKALGDTDHSYSGYFVKVENKEGGDQLITLFNPNTSTFESVRRSSVHLGLQGNSTYHTIKKYHRQVADLIGTSIPENWGDLKVTERNAQMKQNIYNNWDVNPKLAARRDQIARVVLNTTYVPSYNLIKAAIKTGSGFVQLATCPPAALGLFASAGSDVVRYATSLAGRAAGNIIGAGRTEMVVEGFVNGIRNSWQNMWDMWRNKDEIIQGRANKVSLRTFTEDMIESNKLNTIGEKRLTTGAEIKQYKRIAKTVSDLNGLNKAFQDYSEGKMDEATWNEIYKETEDTILRAEGTHPEEIISNLKKFYGYDPLTAEFLDRHGNSLGQLLDMKRKSGLNSLRFYSSIGDMLPKTEEWSSTVAQNMGMEYAKRRGNSLSFSEQQLLARAYREMSIGAYGVSARTEFEASPMGQVFGLFRRYNQSMNHYITQEIRAGRKRNLYNAQAASMFDQFCGDIQYTSKGNIYKPAEHKWDGVIKMGVMGTMGTILPTIGLMVFQQLLMGDDDNGIFNSIMNGMSATSDPFKTIGQKNIATEVFTGVAGVMATTAMFQINHDHQLLNELNKGKQSLSAVRKTLNACFNTIGSSMGGIFVGMGSSTMTRIIHDGMSYLALSSMPGIDGPGGKVLMDEQKNKLMSDFAINLASICAPVRAAVGVAKPIIEGGATGYGAKETYKKEGKVANIYLGDVLGNAGTPGMVSRKKHKADKDNYTRISRKRAAAKRKK